MDFISLLSDNPGLRALQLLLLVSAIISVYFVLFATRDAILRSESFWFQLFSIVLVACLPVVGFLLYLLIRPSRTLKELEMERDIRKLLEKRKSEKEDVKKKREDTKEE